MCGIVGYIGPHEAAGYLLEGLRRLEYRGYDSAGVATIEHGSLLVTKRAGRLDNLAQTLAEVPSPGTIGIGHTRWATHGPATDINAHPHVGGDGAVAIVHNGVIENFHPLKSRLESEGYLFHSATDSEVIAHLVASCLDQQLVRETPHRDAPPAADGLDGLIAPRHRPLVEAVRQALAQLHGTYGLAIVFRDYPDVIIAARLGSPLVVGVGAGRALRGQRRLAPGWPHRQDRLPGRPSTGGHHGRLTARHRSRSRPRGPHGPPARHRGRRRGPRRLSALHAQGDLRAARNDQERDARPVEPRRGHGRVRRLESHARNNCEESTASCSRPAARAGTRRWWAST